MTTFNTTAENIVLPGFETAIVHHLDQAPNPNQRVWISLHGGEPIAATVAIAGSYQPRINDHVLVARNERAEHYIIGVLQTQSSPPTALVAADGSRVSLEQSDNEEQTIAVRNPQGKLLFEHNVTTQRSVVYAPEGDLDFRADHGAIRLSSKHNVVIESDEQNIQLQAGTKTSNISALRIDGIGTALVTPKVAVQADDSELTTRNARLVANSLTSAVQSLRQILGVVDTRAERIVERAKNVYRDVEELAQTRAGRMRLLADTTFHLFGKRTLIKAEEDMKLKGDKIHIA